MEFIVYKDKVAFVPSIDDVLANHNLNKTALYYAMVGYGSVPTHLSKKGYFYCMIDSGTEMSGKLLERSQLNKTKGIRDKTYVKVCLISELVTEEFVKDVVDNVEFAMTSMRLGH